MLVACSAVTRPVLQVQDNWVPPGLALPAGHGRHWAPLRKYPEAHARERGEGVVKGRTSFEVRNLDRINTLIMAYKTPPRTYLKWLLKATFLHSCTFIMRI